MKTSSNNKDIETREQSPVSDTKKYWALMTFYERFEHVIVIILSFLISIIIILAL